MAEDEPTAPGFVAARPEGDVIAKAVAKAKIANQLFERQDRVTIGRYHLLETIGAGGMGTVWGAFDPELDRRVAIKLLNAELAAQRERILAEGQALAKLAHPNVVNVFDVGAVEDQVYIVMEWVRGTTLRAWVTEGPRSTREIVAMYRAAGEGLAAVHDAGLVHRDFKPDNAIVGADRRVRVLDFGLALRGETADDRRSGTPRYMAPEQAGGGEITPAADQFAFCVSLREALGHRDGKRDAELPAWLAQIVDRGTARDATARFPSMTALVAELGRDPAVVWRRRLLVGGAVVVAAGAFAIGTLRGGDVERCAGGRDEIAKVWNAERRANLIAQLAKLGPYAARDAARVSGVLDDAGARWAAAHHGACLARDRGELTPQLYEGNLACLARTRAALAAVVDVLSTTTTEHAPDAIAAVGELPAADGCRTEVEASTVAPPPAAIATRATAISAEVERSRVLARALTPDAITYAEATTAHASALGYRPLIARAKLELGRARMLKDPSTRAVEVFEAAVTAGFEAGDPATAVEAFGLEIHQIAIGMRPSDADAQLARVPMVEAIAAGLGPTGNRARATLYNGIGTVRLAAGDRAGAATAFSTALEALGPDSGHSERPQIEQSLALVTADPVAREQLGARAAVELARLLGPDHPLLLDARVNAAMLIAHPERARAALREPCRRFAEVHPHLASHTVTCWFELGWLAEEMGDLAETRTALIAVRAVGSGIKRDIAGGYLTIFDGDVPKGVAALLAAADHALADASPSVRIRGVAALIGAGTHQPPADAVATLRRAEAALGDLEQSFAHAVLYQRYLARVRARLAQLTHAPEPAAAAARWYRAAGGYDALATELEAIAGSR